MTETKYYIIDGKDFTDFAGFIAEFNRAFADIGPDWHGGLDAFNDYLSWPTSEAGGRYVFVWRHSADSQERLGYPATVAWLQEGMKQCPPEHLRYLTTLSLAAEQEQGPTLFDELVEIIRDHLQVKFRLE